MEGTMRNKVIVLSVAALAIACVGMFAWTRAVGFGSVGWLLQTTLLLVAGWLPFAFLAFAIGRKTLNARMVVVFAAAEIAGAGLAHILATCPAGL
jgi:hypothetical protein